MLRNQQYNINQPSMQLLSFRHKIHVCVCVITDIKIEKLYRSEQRYDDDKHHNPININTRTVHPPCISFFALCTATASPPSVPCLELALWGSSPTCLDSAIPAGIGCRGAAPITRIYPEPRRWDARVPSGWRSVRSVLYISFHRIKALAPISSPTSTEPQQCGDPGG